MPGSTTNTPAPSASSVSTPAPQRIKAWSFTLLKDFEACKYKAKLRAIDKIKDAGNANSNRGNEVHDNAEHFVRGNQEMSEPLKKFREKLIDLKEDFEEGNVLVEENWGFTMDWAATGWFADDIWLRMKLDAFRWLDTDQTIADAIDHKTGKMFGNEVKHAQQGQLYAVGAFMRYPTLQIVHVKFWYLDHGKETVRTYTREQGMKLFTGYNNRGLIVTTETRFPPKPSKMNCLYCPFGSENGNGACEWVFEQ